MAKPFLALASRVDAASPAPELNDSLYEIRQKIYPRAVTGWFAGWRVFFIALTQVVFYGLPWIEWNGRQAVLFDLAARKFYIFGFVFWPQDFIYLTGLLVIAALSLFLFTAVAGRLWCGYACPQTVYTEMFMWIERKIEGDRMRRMKLDAQPWSWRKTWIKGSKHAAWIALALWTGFTFVGYFTPIHTLAIAVPSFSLGPWETFWMFFYGIATYGNAGWMREQVCKYMCPYARFQSVMFDRDTLVIGYDPVRGEPRGPRSRKTDPKAARLGDCVDCGICVQVCPVGIDIRKGLQYECIGCAACIDGCNRVMDKMGYSRGLIRYSTENAMTDPGGTKDILRRVLRPRILIYAALLAVISAVLAGGLYLRSPFKVDVIRDRGALARETSEGLIENVYRLQIMNTDEKTRRFTIRASGLRGISVVTQQPVEVAGATTQAVVVAVRVDPGAAERGSHVIAFHVEDTDEPRIHAEEKSRFFVR